MALLPVAEAQARLFALAAPVAAETVPLDAALGRYLAAPLIAARSQPAANMSAMDGYALAGDARSGWRLVGESAAGRPFADRVEPGAAVRIFTGALLPPGTDRVLIQEEAACETAAGGGTIVRAIAGTPAASAHVRRGGSDFAEGATLLPAGSHIGPAAVALAAMAGHAGLPVHRTVRVAILSTGDELRPPGAPLPPGTIADSNRPMIAAMLAPLPAGIALSLHVPDRLDALTAALAEAADCADIVVTSGGASVGDHDLVLPALRASGIEPDFWKIAMRPGKPLLAARGNGTVYLGLPGNPASAFVTSTLLLLPLLRHCAGSAAPLPRSVTLPLAAPLPAGGARTEYWRARLMKGGAVPMMARDSALLSILAASDALIVRPPDAAPAAAGDPVEIIALPQYVA